MAVTSISPAVKKLFDFLKLSGRLEKSPGFSSILGVGLESLSESQCSFQARSGHNPATLIITGHQLLHRHKRLPGHDRVALSTYLSVIDDVTTWALLLGDEKRSRPGKSVSLWAEWAPAFYGSNALGDENTKQIAAKHGRLFGDQQKVDIIARVNKIGENVGFVDAEIRETDSGQLVCYASHMKYLKMGFVTDWMTSSNGWQATQFYIERFLTAPPPIETLPALEDIFDSLHFVSPNKATFQVSPLHASLGGPIHGGCQGILMEMVATEVAKRALRCSDVTLESMKVEYTSAPSQNVTIHVDTICDHTKADFLGTFVVLRSRIVSQNEKVNSIGILRFVVRAPLPMPSML